MHQLVEYLLGAVLLSQGLQTSKPLVPTVVGVAIIVNATVARGPLSAFPRVAREQHRVLDLVVLGITVLFALTPGDLVRPAMRWVLLAVGAALAFVIWRSDYRTPARAPRRERSKGPTSTEPRAAGTGDRGGQVGGQVGRQAGRVAGQLLNAARRPKRS